MNARDEFRNNLEPTEKEFLLEQELRGLGPWSPSAHLRQRIEAEAARWEPAREEPEDLPFLRRPARGPLVRHLAVIAAAAALVGIVVMPFWMNGPQDEDALAAGNTADQSETEAAREVAPREVIPLERVSDGAVAPEWHQIFVESENEGMVERKEGPPMWRVRYHVLNRKSWQDQETGVTREQFVPEERVLFVPVRYH